MSKNAFVCPLIFIASTQTHTNSRQSKSPAERTASIVSCDKIHLKKEDLYTSISFFQSVYAGWDDPVKMHDIHILRHGRAVHATATFDDVHAVVGSVSNQGFVG